MLLVAETPPKRSGSSQLRFEPILNEDNIKIRSITIKQSNRFNIL